MSDYLHEERATAEEALPCPFCGSQPMLSRRKHTTWTEHTVECDAPACHLSPKVTDTTRADVLEQWNTRAPKAPAAPPPTKSSVSRCNTCNQPILWETFGGARVYRNVDGLLIHNTRCGCGSVQRYANGEAVS